MRRPAYESEFPQTLVTDDLLQRLIVLWYPCALNEILGRRFDVTRVSPYARVSA